jgi:hypothetical protein
MSNSTKFKKNYSVSENFNNGFILKYLRTEIKESPGLSCLEYLLCREDNLEIGFYEELSNEDLIMLDAVIAAHPQEHVVKDKLGKIAETKGAPKKKDNDEAIVGSMSFDTDNGELYFCTAVDP